MTECSPQRLTTTTTIIQLYAPGRENNSVIDVVALTEKDGLKRSFPHRRVKCSLSCGSSFLMLDTLNVAQSTDVFNYGKLETFLTEMQLDACSDHDKQMCDMKYERVTIN